MLRVLSLRAEQAAPGRAWDDLTAGGAFLPGEQSEWETWEGCWVIPLQEGLPLLGKDIQGDPTAGRAFFIGEQSEWETWEGYWVIPLQEGISLLGNNQEWETWEGYWVAKC